MNCLSCQSNIDPKWKHAIDNNVCPFCGDSIMPEDLKEHISNLSITLSSFQEAYPEQLEDWILSNFQYVKTTGDRIKQFFPEPKVIVRKKSAEDDSYEEDEGIIDVQDQETTSKFFKNAGAMTNVKRADEIKKMISQIKSENPQSYNTQISLEENYDQDESDNHYDSTSDDPFEDKIPASVLAFAGKKGGKNSPDHNMMDLIKLQNMHDKIRESRQNVINGTGGKGSFSRG